MLWTTFYRRSGSLTYLKVLNFLGELDILNRKTLLVRGDIHNGAVQLFNLDVKFADGNFELLNDLLDSDLLLSHILNLSQQLVYFGLEFRLFLLYPEDKETYRVITKL